jgi:hypothetical protein
MISKLSAILTLGSLMSIIMCQTATGQKRTSSNTESIHVSRLNRSKVIGSLGYALGGIIVIEGVVADESYTGRKADAGELLLRVQAVNGKPLNEEVIFAFRPFLGASIKSPPVGARFKYTGYETGGFSGIPEKAFAYVPRVQATGYNFSTTFVVLRDESGRR